MEKIFFVPGALAAVAIVCPLAYIFRVSDAAWKISAMSSVPGGIWALCVPTSMMLMWRAYKKVSSRLGENTYAPYEKPLDGNYYNNLPPS